MKNIIKATIEMGEPYGICLNFSSPKERNDFFRHLATVTDTKNRQPARLTDQVLAKKDLDLASLVYIRSPEDAREDRCTRLYIDPSQNNTLSGNKLTSNQRGAYSIPFSEEQRALFEALKISFSDVADVQFIERPSMHMQLPATLLLQEETVALHYSSAPPVNIVNIMVSRREREQREKQVLSFVPRREIIENLISSVRNLLELSSNASLKYPSIIVRQWQTIMEMAIKNCGKVPEVARLFFKLDQYWRKTNDNFGDALLSAMRGANGTQSLDVVQLQRCQQQLVLMLDFLDKVHNGYYDVKSEADREAMVMTVWNQLIAEDSPQHHSHYRL